MGTYYQLTQKQRYQIAVLLETGHQQNDIASIVGVDDGTVGEFSSEQAPMVRVRANMLTTRAGRNGDRNVMGFSRGRLMLDPFVKIRDKAAPVNPRPGEYEAV